MRKYYIFTSIILNTFLSIKIYSQHTEPYASKWQLKVSAGANIPLSDLKQNRETDYLLEYSDKTQVIPTVSVTYFFGKWGVEGSLKFNYFTESSKASEKFQTVLNERYNEDYYINGNTVIYDALHPVLATGVVYRMETENWYFYPKFAIGVTSFGLNWGAGKLKERDTNMEYSLSYAQKARAKDHFTFIPSVSMGYKMSKRFWLDLNVNSSFFKTNFSYDKELKNNYTGAIQTETITYKKNIVDLYMSLGLLFIIK